MAAAALVATADGEVTFSELTALDDILETVTDLQIYDPHVAVDIYRDYADAISANPDAGRREAFKAVGRVGENPEAAELIIQVAVAISRADGEFTAPEANTISELCGVLGVPVPEQA